RGGGYRPRLLPVGVRAGAGQRGAAVVAAVDRAGDVRPAAVRAAARAWAGRRARGGRPARPAASGHRAAVAAAVRPAGRRGRRVSGRPARVDRPAAGEQRLLTGWGRTAPSRARVVRPDSEQVVDLVRAATATGPGGRGLLARGLGRAYGDAAQNGGGT